MGREVAPLLDLVKGVASPYIKFPKVSSDITTTIIFLTINTIVDIIYALQIWVDNYVFRLHCKLTALILFLSCTLGEI